MSAYLARLKQFENEKNSHYVPDSEPSKPTKAPFDPFEGTGTEHNEKKIIDAPKPETHFMWHMETKSEGELTLTCWPPKTLAQVLQSFPDAVRAEPIPDG